jgi:hypothetical protein
LVARWIKPGPCQSFSSVKLLSGIAESLFIVAIGLNDQVAVFGSP